MTGLSLKLILKFANKTFLAENSQPNSKLSDTFVRTVYMHVLFVGPFVHVFPTHKHSYSCAHLKHSTTPCLPAFFAAYAHFHLCHRRPFL